jgi:pyruvate kinase
VEAVLTMDRIVRRTEQAERLWAEPPPDMALGHAANAIAQAAVTSARSLHDTAAIVVYTGSGGTARLISDYRPRVPILAFTPEASTYQSLALYWGVIPVLFGPSTPGGESIFIDLDRALLARDFERGARVVIVMGWPIKAKTSANLLKLHRVGESLHPT